MFLQNIKCIFGRIPAVDDNGPIDLSRQLQLAAEPVPLYLMGRLVPIIVKPNFSHRYYLGIHGSCPKPGKFFFIQLRAAAGMDSRRPVYLGIAFRQLQRVFGAGHIISYIYNCLNSMLGKALQQFFPVFVKCLIIVMGMCIKNHLFPPVFLSVLVFIRYSRTIIANLPRKNNDYRGFTSVFTPFIHVFPLIYQADTFSPA